MTKRITWFLLASAMLGGSAVASQASAPAVAVHGEVGR